MGFVINTDGVDTETRIEQELRLRLLTRCDIYDHSSCVPNCKSPTRKPANQPYYQRLRNGKPRRY